MKDITEPSLDATDCTYNAKLIKISCSVWMQKPSKTQNSYPSHRKGSSPGCSNSSGYAVLDELMKTSCSICLQKPSKTQNSYPFHKKNIIAQVHRTSLLLPF